MYLYQDKCDHKLFISKDTLSKNLFSGEYIGQRLRENGFDPKGKSTSTMLDDLVSDQY